MSVRQWLPLIGLVLCVFVFNMSEFMPIGLLTSIADDFGVSESQAGYLISVYAWAVALLSLPMMLLLRRMQYRPMLLLFVGMFAFFQVMSGVATDYWMLLISRLGVAVAHAVFREMSLDAIKKLFKNVPDQEKVLLDVKGIFTLEGLKTSGLRYWRL